MRVVFACYICGRTVGRLGRCAECQRKAERVDHSKWDLSASKRGTDPKKSTHCHLCGRVISRRRKKLTPFINWSGCCDTCLMRFPHVSGGAAMEAALAELWRLL